MVETNAKAKSDVLVSIRGLCFARGERMIFDDVDMDILRGKVTTIMGPSGAGKSTLLNVIGMLDDPSSGSYRLDGEDVSTLNDARRSRIRNQKVGFIFQSFNLIPDLDVFDNVDVPLRYPAQVRDQASLRREEGYLSECGFESLGVADAVDWDAAWATRQVHVVEMRGVKDSWIRDVVSFPSPMCVVPYTHPNSGSTQFAPRPG